MRAFTAGFQGLGLCVLLVGLCLAACGDSDDGPSGQDGGNDESDAATAPKCERDEDCDDGLFCTGEETCGDGACVAGKALECDDKIACTLDHCSERTQQCEVGAPDFDGDGHYAADCLGSDGKPVGDDCDDDDALRFPGNIEYCDPDHRDEDCNPKTFGLKDSDDDGFQDGACCNAASNAKDAKLVCGDDCDDLKAAVSPKAAEVCDQFDNDCDGTTDEDVAVKQYADADRDGHGAAGSAVKLKCAGTVGFAPSKDDCDDHDPERFTGQFEICDDKDNDCDGKTDEVRQDAPWFLDVDQDGFGDSSSTPIYSCERIPGRVLSHNDCRDDSPMIHPAAAERCDAVDNDCNGVRDFALGVNNFEDDDGEGIADAKCEGGEDCDDRNPASGLGQEEICDNVDNDCDNAIDEDTAQTVWFLDRDGDGWGVKEGTALTRCEPIPGRAANLGDCDDERNDAHPGAPELCNGHDDDCNGKTDEGTDSQCVLDDAVGVCTSGACAVLSCYPGHDDCNDVAADGCECAVTIAPIPGQFGSCLSDLGCQDGNYCNGYERCELSDHLCYPGTPVNCAASATVLQGDAFIRNSLDIAALAGVQVITGNLVVSASGLKNLTGLESLRTIGGNLVVDGDMDGAKGSEANGVLTALVGSGLSNLITVGGEIRIEDNPALTTLHLPSLVAAGGLLVRRNAALTKIYDFPNLAKLAGPLAITEHTALTQVDFTALTAVTDTLIIDNNVALTDLRMPKLASLGEGEQAASLEVRGNPVLTALGKFGASKLTCVSGSCRAAIEQNVALCNALGLVRRLAKFDTLSVVDNRFEDCADTAVASHSRVRTFDGFGYTSQPVGEVVLAHSITDTLEIQMRVASYNERSDTAYPSAIVARVGTDTVGVYQYDSTLHVNGVSTPVTPGAWLELASGGRVTLQGDAYRVMWPDGSALHLRPTGDRVEAAAQLSPDRRGKVEGLWGTADGNATGQLVTRTGIPLGAPLPFYTFYDLFIETWRIAQQESLFEYSQGLDTSSYTYRAWPTGIRISADLDPVVAANAQTACADAEITHAFWLEACVVDYAASNDNVVLDSYSRFADPSDSLDETAPPTSSIIGNFPPFTADPSDQSSLVIKQTLPTSNAVDIDVHTGITVYFDDEIDPSSVSDSSFIVTIGNYRAYGLLSGMLSESGNTILFFQPLRTLPLDTVINVSMPGNGIVDDGGNPMDGSYSFSFTTSAVSLPSPSDLSFEDGIIGWSLVGDASIVTSPFGSVIATNQSHMAMITTGDIGSGAASGGTTSALSSGLISVPQGATRLRFDWDFASEEFAAQSVYDDAFTLTVSGPGGTITTTVASVNGVRGAVTIVTVPGLSGAQHTGWQHASFDISSLGSPITVSFTLSDVGDVQLTSALFVDNLRLQ